MRLSQVDIQKIREVVAAEFGPQSVVILFGSRVDDSARGGDVDLMITVDGRPANLPFATSLLAARLTRVLGGRAVDVIVRTADSGRQPIHEIAERTGVRI